MKTTLADYQDSALCFGTILVESNCKGKKGILPTDSACTWQDYTMLCRSRMASNLTPQVDPVLVLMSWQFQASCDQLLLGSAKEREMGVWKRPWCWERLKAGGEGDDRGWDGLMASPTQWMLSFDDDKFFILRWFQLIDFLNFQLAFSCHTSEMFLFWGKWGCFLC